MNETPHSPTTLPGAGRQATQPAGGPESCTACWNEVGVYGNGRCSKLPEFIHCRNCPAFAAAGVQLLDRALPADYRRNLTEHFAARKTDPEAGNASLVLFRIEAEWLALPTLVFQEVTDRRTVHSLPHRHEGVILGLANVRGELLLVVSLGHLLGLDEVPPHEVLRAQHHRLLVAAWDNQRVAFPAAEVHGPLGFHASDLKPPPASSIKSSPRCIQALLYWQKRAVGCLDPALLSSALYRSLT